MCVCACVCICNSTSNLYDFQASAHSISTLYLSQLCNSTVFCLFFPEFTSHVHVVTHLVGGLLPLALGFPFFLSLSSCPHQFFVTLNVILNR